VIVACLDLEGVLIPEVWIGVAETTGIPELRRTTRDEPDYDKLMRERLALLDRHKLGLKDIQAVIDTLNPMEGALDFLNRLRERYQVVILSDTYYEFAEPFMRKLGWPTIFCHRLECDANGRLVDYKLRLPDHKRAAVTAFRQLNFQTIATGDSYNDTAMLGAADYGILFRAPDNVAREFPQFPVVRTYDALYDTFEHATRSIAAPR
jgi:phosphoserine/homoserine phosphotransferase